MFDDKNKEFKKIKKEDDLTKDKLRREIKEILNDPKVEETEKLSHAIRRLNKLEDQFPDVKEEFEEELTRRAIEELKRKGKWE